MTATASIFNENASIAKYLNPALHDLTKMKIRMAKRVLFIRLLDHVARSEPKVTITHYAFNELMNLVAGLSASEAVWQSDGLWDLIWTNIDWSDVRKQDGVQCGNGFLRFFGHLADATANFSLTPCFTVSLEICIMALVAIQNSKKVINYKYKEDKWWAAVTAYGQTMLGLTGRIPLIMKPPSEDDPLRIFYETGDEYRESL